MADRIAVPPALVPPGKQALRVQVQRTMRCSVRRAYATFLDPLAIRKWAGAKATVDPREGARLRIGPDEGTLERVVPNSRLRVRWGSEASFPDSWLEVEFVPKARDRVTVTFAHSGLFDPLQADAARDAWRQALQRFQASVEPRPYEPRVPSPSHRAPRRPRVPTRRRPTAQRARQRGKRGRRG